MSGSLLRNHFRHDGTPKTGFKDEAAALDRADLINDDVNVYECDFCGEWHLGHGKPKGKK